MAEVSNEVWTNSQPVRKTRLYRLAGTATYERQEPIGTVVETRPATSNETELLLAAERDEPIMAAAPRLKNIEATLEQWATDASVDAAAWNGANTATRNAIMTRQLNRLSTLYSRLADLLRVTRVGELTK